VRLSWSPLHLPKWETEVDEVRSEFQPLEITPFMCASRQPFCGKTWRKLQRFLNKIHYQLYGRYFVVFMGHTWFWGIFFRSRLDLLIIQHLQFTYSFQFCSLYRDGSGWSALTETTPPPHSNDLLNEALLHE